MRQGCISLGNIECDNCQIVIPYAERYLLINEEDGAETESGKKRWCKVRFGDLEGWVAGRYLREDSTPPTPEVR